MPLKDHRSAILLASGLIIFLISAVFSEGYHHPDEHFQILEFANYKLGASPASGLSWEFAARIRPALQPALAYWAIRAMRYWGMVNPFQEVMVLRMLSAVLSVWLFALVANRSGKSLPVKNGSSVLLSLCFLLWFMPYLQVRFSSECWSGLTFLAAMYLLLPLQTDERMGYRNWIASGLLLGFAFFFRFQMGFAIAGVFAWLLFRRISWQALTVFVLSGLVAGALGVAIDYWFYGEPVFTPYAYFAKNIFEHKAADWGLAPWWFYFSEFLADGVPPVSLLLFVLFFAGFYAQRRHLFAWSLAPYLLAHIVVGHKEMRFLFPMVFPFLFFVAAGWGVWAARFAQHRLWRFVWPATLVVNGLLLLFRIFSPAQEAVPYLHYLYDYAQQRPTTVFSEGSAANRLVGLELNFYTPAGLHCVTLENYGQLLDTTCVRYAPGDLLLMHHAKKPAGLPRNPQLIYTIFPKWLLRYNFNHWQDRSRIWMLYRL